MKKRRVWPWALTITVLLTVIALVTTWLQTSPIPYSSLNSTEQGTKGIYRLLQEREVPVDRWETGWDRLPESTGHVLWVIQPEQKVYFPEVEGEWLKRWVKKGNTVVIWSGPKTPLSQELGFDAAQSADGVRKVKMAPTTEGWLKEVHSLYFPHGHQVEGSPDRVWMDEQGSPRVGKRSMGRGAIYYIPEPDVITNQAIDRADNLALALHMASFTAGEGKVWFDESVHQSVESTAPAAPSQPGTPSTVEELLTPLMRLLLAQLLLGGILWLYLQGKRFGAPRLEPIQEKATGDEYIRGMASLYQWAGLKQESLAIQLEGLLRETNLRMGLSPKASRAELWEQIEKRMGPTACKGLQDLADQVEGLTPPVKRSSFLRISQALQKWKEELEEWTRNRSGR